MNIKGIKITDVTLEALEYFFQGEEGKAAFYFAVIEMSKTQGDWLGIYQGNVLLKEIEYFHKDRSLYFDFATYRVPEELDKANIIKLHQNGVILLKGFFETLESILIVQESLTLGNDMLNPIE